LDSSAGFYDAICAMVPLPIPEENRKQWIWRAFWVWTWAIAGLGSQFRMNWG
jgi:hypothetical protein